MKYFSKSFFRFALGFLAIILASLLIMAAVSVYAAGIFKIAFITDEQTVKPNELSLPITLQTQDSSGVSFQTPETLDLEFNSSSATGEFLGSTGNVVTKTMNKNTANRTFYYRDRNEGVFTIKVTATGRDSKETWSTEQKITISLSTTPQSISGEVLGENTENAQSSVSGSASPVYGTPNSQLEVYAGGNRLTSPGSPITFQAIIKKNTSSNGSVSFSWSFGDGNVGEGALVSHMYRYPGEYAVVLNAKSGNTFAASRLKVSVLDPEIEVTDRGDYLEISNKSSSEVNLFNWKIINNDKGFVFPPDTIIFPKSGIMIDKSLLKMKGMAEDGTVLKNFLGKVVASSPRIMEKEDLKRIALEVKEIQNQAVSILNQAISKGLVREYVPKNNIAALGASNNPNGSVLKETAEKVPSELSEKVIFESPKSQSFMQKIKSLILSIFNPVRNRK